jgi:hypothetical protein
MEGQASLSIESQSHEAGYTSSEAKDEIISHQTLRKLHYLNDMRRD